ARSMPGWSHTRQTRPSRCCTVIPSKGSFSPYSGWVGSMTSTVSVGRAVSPIGVVSSVGLAPDGQIYVMGGIYPFCSSGPVCTRVEAYNPDANTWATKQAMPTPRQYFGLATAPDGNLYAVGGYLGSGDPALRHRGEVFEYDHLANAWTTRAPMPTPRRAMSVAMVGERIFAIGGFNGAPLDIVEEAVLDHLQTVGAGGPYSAGASTTVQLNATASDPDGDALSFAWDVDGDLVYETPGQNPVATVPHRPSGAYPVRVRALDSKGGYAVATATLNIFCGPRPKVGVQTQKLGPGQLRATIMAGLAPLGLAPLGLLRLGQPRPISNARVDVLGGPSNITAAQDVPVSGAQVVFTVARQPADQTPVMVPFQVIDACTPALPWSSFVGFGAGY
ncbi:MAG TPA: PKD domain-containing protein, partial [Chloroflexota bacterium]|nr:PKD domain-containing protein [Chloroflexota bacterium]